MRRIILAAAGSGSGKTLISCGLIRCLKSRGHSVQAYKCGPDYIDPLFHRSLLDVPSENLDTFFCDDEQIMKILSYGSDKDISLIEGVMGIYDGLGAVSDIGSAYNLAEVTNTPIVLIADGKGMGRTLVSVLKGIISDDKHKLIKGIILNNISGNLYDTLRPLIEKETGICVIGYLPRLKGIKLESRHLGLKLPYEIEDLNEQIDKVAGELDRNLDFEKLLEIALLSQSAGAGKLDVKFKAADKNVDYDIKNNNQNNKQNNRQNINQVNDAFTKCDNSEGINKTDASNAKCENDDNAYAKPCRSGSGDKLRLAVANDEVFCFIYEDNLRILSEYGIECVFFSPLHDRQLPEGVNGILLPGGYPELRLKELSSNISMLTSIRDAIDKYIPVLAECGGFMYLHESVADDEGKIYSLVGAVKGECHNTGKLCRFGYIEAEVNGRSIKGHEFHYYDSSSNGNSCTAVKPLTGKSWEFGFYNNGSLIGFPHLYYRSCPEFVEDFYKAMAMSNSR